MSAKWGDSDIHTITFKKDGVSNDVKQVKKGNGQIVWCKPFTLTKSLGTGVSSFKIIRTATSEPTAGFGPNVELSNGATIYYGDTIVVTNPVCYSGYAVDSYTTQYAVKGDLAISLTASLIGYTLGITQNTGVSSVTVTRTGSPYAGASKTTLSNGSTIYYGDTLTVSATASSGYAMDSYTTSYIVAGNITVAPTAHQNLPKLADPVLSYYQNEYYGDLNMGISNPNNVTVHAHLYAERYWNYDASRNPEEMWNGNEEFVNDFDLEYDIPANSTQGVFDLDDGEVWYPNQTGWQFSVTFSNTNYTDSWASGETHPGS